MFSTPLGRGIEWLLQASLHSCARYRGFAARSQKFKKLIWCGKSQIYRIYGTILVRREGVRFFSDQVIKCFLVNGD